MNDSKRILVVDDQCAIRYVIKQMLSQLHYDVHLVESGEDALELLKEDSTFDLMLCDVHMKEMDGLEVLKACPVICPNLPVVLMSAYSKDYLIVDAIRLGAVDYLIKPFEVSDLRAVLQRVGAVNDKPLVRIPSADLADDIRLNFVMRSRNLNLPGLQDIIKKSIQIYTHLPVADQLNLALAFEEAVLNAHEHGNLELKSAWKENVGPNTTSSLFEKTKQERLQVPTYSSRKIRIGLVITKSKVEISVEDDGEGYKPNLDNDRHGNGEAKPYGMGLLLIKNLMDEVDLNENGTRITFRKRITSS